MVEDYEEKEEKEKGEKGKHGSSEQLNDENEPTQWRKISFKIICQLLEYNGLIF